jgi:hypothetical protein
MKKKEIIADLCRRVANAEPWKDGLRRACIRETGSGFFDYCGGCPVIDTCTYEGKMYEQEYP